MIEDLIVHRLTIWYDTIGYFNVFSGVIIFFAMNVGKTAATTGSQDTKATSHVDSSQAQSSSGISGPCSEWCEATTSEGYTYYWNTITKGENIASLHWNENKFLQCWQQQAELLLPSSEWLRLTSDIRFTSQWAGICPPKKIALPRWGGALGPHLIHCFLGPRKSMSQMASQLVQLF